MPTYNLAYCAAFIIHDLRNKGYRKTNLFTLNYKISDREGNFINSYSLEEVKIKIGSGMERNKGRHDPTEAARGRGVCARARGAAAGG